MIVGLYPYKRWRVNARCGINLIFRRFRFMGETNVKQTKYPLGFWVSCLTYSFERFAFYGSKPLLVLFLVTAVSKGGLGISEVEGGIIASNFTAWTYISPVIGGWICDRFLGARYAVSIGCLLMGLGYLIGWKATSVTGINLMILVVSIGTRSEEHTSELQSRQYLVCRLLLEKKN